jgi:hypothetical protein
MSKLPNTEQAHIPLEKLTNYSLSTEHTGGKNKARVFQAALGLTAADAEWLRERIIEAIQTTDATEQTPSDFGRRYVVDFTVTTRTGSAPVRTAWMVRNGEDFPRLTSCYVIGDKAK